jgi:hypothetical protein
MRILKTTDGLHLGVSIPDLNTGDVLDLNGFEFVVEVLKTLDNGHIVLSNFNYSLECEA